MGSATTGGDGGGGGTPDAGPDEIDPKDVGVDGDLQGVDPKTDTDGDGIPDIVEGTADKDGDDVPAHLDPDETGPDEQPPKEMDAGQEDAAPTGTGPPGPGEIGSACTDNDACDPVPGSGFAGGNNDADCLTDTGFFTPEVVGGYCSAPCFGGDGRPDPTDQDTGCGEDYVCSEQNNCLSKCETDADCRKSEGYSCLLTIGGCTDGNL
jgi:hypothetical protein